MHPVNKLPREATGHHRSLQSMKYILTEQLTIIDFKSSTETVLSTASSFDTHIIVTVLYRTVSWALDFAMTFIVAVSGSALIL